MEGREGSVCKHLIVSCEVNLSLTDKLQAEDSGPEVHIGGDTCAPANERVGADGCSWA